jgi:hypothetical protein
MRLVDAGLATIEARAIARSGAGLHCCTGRNEEAFDVGPTDVGGNWLREYRLQYLSMLAAQTHYRILLCPRRSQA